MYWAVSATLMQQKNLIYFNRLPEPAGIDRRVQGTAALLAIALRVQLPSN